MFKKKIDTTINNKNSVDMSSSSVSLHKQSSHVSKKIFIINDINAHETNEFCHTYSSRTGVSAQRSRAAAGASFWKATNAKLTRSAKRHIKKRHHAKKNKQENRLLHIKSTEKSVRLGRNFSQGYLQENVVVFDGGIKCETAIHSNSDTPSWCCHKIEDDILLICDPPSIDIGLIYKEDTDVNPCFILLPRTDALAINKDGREFCKAMMNIAKKQSNVVRGKSKQVFGNNKYCCVGAKRRRYSPGIEPGLYKLTCGSKTDWDCVVSAVKRAEHAFYAFSNTEIIRHIRDARELIEWDTINFSDATDEVGARIFNGIAFGVNVYLRAHIDNDFTYSVIQVHQNDVDYAPDDKTVCFFCFPRLGVAVPLKPGDFLLINALEYHCLSSRCDDAVDIFCVSSYLKTAVVSGNDNSKLLTHKELECMSAYDKWGDEKRSVNKK
jgi:hypothetical protein